MNSHIKFLSGVCGALTFLQRVTAVQCVLNGPAVLQVSAEGTKAAPQEQSTP